MNEVGRRLEDTYEYARDSAKELPRQAEELGDAAGDEVSKIHQIEYKIVDLNPSLSSTEIEAQLLALGRERWDCFFAREVPSSLQMFCKRPPKTILRYIPRIF